MDTVLVTGGTGFIARWCIAELLEQGFTVRTTVRDLSRTDAVRAGLGEAVDPGDRLAFVVADLTADDGWDAAVDGCRYVLHPASPLGTGTAESMLTAARDGARRVLRAAHSAGVERVVMTSAANASSPASYRDDSVTDETLWTDPDAPGVDGYRRSKTLAELASWELVDEVGDRKLLTTILPGAVFGPVLGADQLGSVQVIGRMLRDEMSRLPRIGLEVVDARDVADAHIRAMTTLDAAGERFLATGQLVTMADMAAALRAELGAAAARVPTKTVPDVVLKLMARRKPELAGVLPGLGRRHRHTTEKARKVLGWQPRPAREAVVACGRSLVEHGVV
jgi:dihydroflavonol-4-reductase